MTLDEYFAGYEESRRIYDALAQAVASTGPVEVRVTRSQVAFVSGKPFAWAWVPGRYLGPGRAPLVLTLSFDQPDPSPRWKEIAHPARNRYTHHLELFTPAIDAEILAWLGRARQNLHLDSPGVR